MSRSQRYPGAIDIRPEWADEAASDPTAVRLDEPALNQRKVARLTGYSPSAGFVVTVLVDLTMLQEPWGITAWKTSGRMRRLYWETKNADQES